jgi:hypothetical protein
MATSDKEQDRGFTVIDRRGGREDEEPVAERPADTTRAEPVGEPSDPEAQPVGALPAVDFPTFVISLGSSALYHLGAAGDPEGGERVEAPNLQLARQVIDTLEMLEQKTRGNLDAEESRLLESMLYDLRMRFVEASQ